MKIHDISMEIRPGMVVYKNKKDKKPRLVTKRTHAQGAYESSLTLDAHTGTHADAPFHMLARGATIESLPLSSFMGSCVVWDVSKNIPVTEKDLRAQNAKHILRKNDILILKTRNKPLVKFNKTFSYLEMSGAQYLVEKRIRMVGIDQLGIERNQPGHDTHKILFRNNIAIVEGLELSKIKAGRYFFIGLPLKIKNGDASPIRAVLVEGL